MRHYVAIVEDAGPETAIGVWFPDLPGCFSAGDTIEEAMQNAPEAIELYRDALAKDGRELPHPRSLSELKQDPHFAADVRGNLVALVPATLPAEAAE
jgi:predicted RNase H-like HicB family nuclease